jgi:DNA-binding IclR family transcriptional regulator
MIGHRRGGMSNKEISQELLIATSSCCYILSRLERDGYVARDADSGKYEIGLKVLSIANAALRPMSFHRAAEPLLLRLASDTGLEGVMGVLNQDRLVLINRVPSREFSQLDVDIGSEFPVHATAVGKAILAHWPETRILDLLRKRGLDKLTPKTITSPSAFLAELEQVRKRGYSVSDEEQVPGLRAVGAPIFDLQGTVRAAVALTGTTKQPMWRDIGIVVDLVKTAAREISRLARLSSPSTSTY